MKDSLKIAIAGATGYTGLELIKILLKHPKVKISYLCAQKSIGKSIKAFDRNIKKNLPKITKVSKIKWDNINVIFELIMEEAKNITHADGRTLYMKSEDGKTMNFVGVAGYNAEGVYYNSKYPLLKTVLSRQEKEELSQNKNDKINTSSYIIQQK